jgi:hypothetical protein
VVGLGALRRWFCAFWLHRWKIGNPQQERIWDHGCVRHILHLASQYRRLAGRRGRKRALIAVGHSMLVIFYYMFKAGTTYADLGGNFFDRLEPAADAGRLRQAANPSLTRPKLVRRFWVISFSQAKWLI